MRKTCLSILLLVVFLATPSVWAVPVTLSGSGWTITADPEAAELTISHDKLGVVLQSIRLQQISGGQVILAEHWTASVHGDNQLTVKTKAPLMTWRFEVSENQLRISSTSAEAILTGQAPASAQRILARLLDREGMPVDWVGTGEVAVTYGGQYTHNASFLPRRNPEVAYFGLGQISGHGLHSLFDRPSDVAIDFSEDTDLHRNSQNLDLLDVRIPVPGNTSLRTMPDYFTKILGMPFYVPYDDSHFPSAPMVWSSWTSYYERVTESDIVQNADWIAAHLGPYGFQFVQLDDGYDRGPKGEHSWTTNWDQIKFPHDPRWLADYIRSKGLRPGIWLVPNSHAASLAQHPDWYLYYRNGQIVRDYNTPALDSTNPAVLNFLSQEFRTIVGWGYEYFKIDGEHAIPKYVPNVDLSRLHDKKIDPLLAYRNRLAVIRKAIGRDSFVEGDIAGTPLNGVGYIDAFFNGDDLYDNWQGMYSLFSSINANVFFNHLTAYTHPGEGMALEPRISFEEGLTRRNPTVIDTERQREFPLTGFGTTLPEARTVVSLVALTGVVYSLGSVMPELPEDRIQLLQKTLPTVPIFPIDLFSRGTDMGWDKFKSTTTDDYIHNYPEIVDVKVQSAAGNYDVVASTNWRTSEAHRELDFKKKLGLDSAQPYIAFDFWNQQILGVFRDSMDLDIDSHDTRVICLHPLLNRPQLVGNSRHISGSYSVLGVAWDNNSQTLRGSVQTISGSPYTLWIYVPDGRNAARVTASAGEHEIQVTHAQDGNALHVTFTGQTVPVKWEVAFAGKRN